MPLKIPTQFGPVQMRDAEFYDVCMTCQMRRQQEYAADNPGVQVHVIAYTPQHRLHHLHPRPHSVSRCLNCGTITASDLEEVAA